RYLQQITEMERMKLLRVSQPLRRYMSDNGVLLPPKNASVGRFRRDCSHIFLLATQLDPKKKNSKSWKQVWFYSPSITAADRFELFMSSSLKRQCKLYRLSHFAGGWKAGFSGDGGLAQEAQFQRPVSVCVFPDDKVGICDKGNST